ncbi:MAG: Gfo/Idh/MocA family protein [Acidobacteriota bacterium]
MTRRDLLKRAAAAAAFPAIVPQSARGANDRIQVGVIGIGFRANLLIDQLPEPGRIVALADCLLARAEEAKARRNKQWDVYQDYRRILDRKDIDAVIVATQDFDRVIPSIHACQAGKDVYAEKPLTLYPGEGRALVKAARKHKTVFQVGTQQRSMEMDQIACKLVRTGGLGKIKLVQAMNYPDAKPFAGLAEEPKPDNVAWDVWTGQAPMRPYSAKLVSSWAAYQDYAGGETTNWGAHGLDMVQMALGMDTSGPVEFWPLAEPAGGAAFRYANGVEVRLEVPYGKDNEYLLGGARFLCERGSIEIWRNNFRIDAPGVTLDLPPQEDIDKWRDQRALWQAQYHMGFWLECIPSRRRPNADVETGHRSVTVCHLANLARRLNRTLRWDPKEEQVIGDKEANALALARPRRKGWELPKI